MTSEEEYSFVHISFEQWLENNPDIKEEYCEIEKCFYCENQLLNFNHDDDYEDCYFCDLRGFHQDNKRRITNEYKTRYREDQLKMIDHIKFIKNLKQ